MERPVLSVSSFASFWKLGCDVRTVLITSERVTPGIPAKQFLVHDWSTGEEFVTYACHHRPVEDLTGQPAEPAGADGRPPGQPNEDQARFPSLSCDDLDALAAQMDECEHQRADQMGYESFTVEWWWISVTKWSVDLMSFQTLLGHIVEDFQIVSKLFHGIWGLKKQTILNPGKSQMRKLVFWQMMASGQHVKLISINSIPLTSTDLGITGFIWAKMKSNSLESAAH